MAVVAAHLSRTVLRSWLPNSSKILNCRKVASHTSFADDRLNQNQQNACFSTDSPRNDKSSSLNDVEAEVKRKADGILSSKEFRKDVENVIRNQMKDGDVAGFLALQQQVQRAAGSEGHRGGYIPRPVIPIDDIGDNVPSCYVKGEKELRCKLASLYRLIDHFGWTQSVYNHITVCVDEEQRHFLLNPFGLLYHEVTASSLIKVDVNGQMIDSGSTRFGVNVPGFVLHSAVHTARPDIKCVVHIHHASCIAVASMKCGLLPVSQEAAIIGNVSYHDFHGILVDMDERELIAKNLGSNNVMLLRNHGVIAAGRSVEEAFGAIYHTVLACEAQVRMMSAGRNNIVIASEEAVSRTSEVVRCLQDMIADGALDSKEDADEELRWGIGDLEFEAYMRMMDSAGYRTGYTYRLPSVWRTKV